MYENKIRGVRNMKKQHLLLVDGMALLFRAFFATAVSRQFMINSSGIPTNAVQGYMKHLLTAVENLNPTHVAVCWDMGSVTFRNDLYDSYKANRDAPPLEMRPQFDIAKEVTEAFGIPNIGIAGFEADDCIGTICQQLKPEVKISVLTGDRDLLQILDEGIDIVLLQKGIGNYKTYTTDLFIEEYGIQPKQMVDVKAFMGDASDGYPGVKGIGEKTALKLIEKYNDIEGVLANMHLLTPAQQKKIIEDTDMLHLSRQLAEIHCEVPITIEIEACIWGEIPKMAIDFVHQYELKTVRNHLLKYELISEVEEVFGSGV